MKQVGAKDFSLKEKSLSSGILEDKLLAGEKLAELVAVRQRFITELYQNVFPIEVLPLSNADAGAEGQCI